jgi:hypothetical protein
VPESEWKRHQDESARIIGGELWAAAHARIKSTSAALLRKADGKLIAQRESFAGGKYLLSSFLACGADAVFPRAHGGTVCGKPMVATQRGRNLVRAYVCRGARERGSSFCSNGSAVPMTELNAAVVKSLRQTFSVETFEAHLRMVANDTVAQDARRAERDNLLAQIPKLAAEEANLARAIAAGVSLDAVLAELKAKQAAREAAEERVTELEGVERDVRANQGQVEQLRETWKDWSGALDADRDNVPLGRQVLKKVLVGQVYVRPAGNRTWAFAGLSRFDGVLAGGLSRGEVVSFQRTGSSPAGAVERLLLGLGASVTPIAGGSDAAPDRCGTGCSSDMAPKPPGRSRDAPRPRVCRAGVTIAPGGAMRWT